MKLFNNLSGELAESGIKPSIQRVKILEYLIKERNHPTAEELFHDLEKDVNSLSKATVYNTLALFAKKGLVRVLTFENNENRYDVDTLDHGHFFCESCGAVADFKIDISDFKADALEKCKITQKDVYFRGVCAACLAKEQPD
jgi:Fur family peroxide stress response transcriptional regulator